jgi:hypothetical protein
VRKNHSTLAFSLAVTLLLGAARAASAQEQAVIRGDVFAAIGWLAAGAGSNSPYGGRDWAHSLFGAASAGWHWTDNIKTEIDFGGGTEAHAYSTQQVTIAGRPSYVTTQSRFARRTLGLGLQYQFFHNAWFHPHLAAGANLTWERRTDDIGPVFYFDDVSRTSRLLENERIEGPRTTFTVRPFVAAGFKAYMTPRTFFRSDLRVAFHSRLDETLLRFGFGFDF